MTNREIIQTFVDRINAHDVAGLGELMSDDHTFIDVHGNHVSGKDQMLAGWRGYFDWFPDYFIEVSEVFAPEATPAVRDGVVYTGTSDGFRFFAVDAKTGRLRFNFDAKGAVFSSPALAGRFVYFGSSNGKFYALEANTGKLVWQFQTESAKQDPMKILNPDGGLNNEAAYAPYFRDYQDMVLAFYRIFSVGAIWSSPAVSNGVVFFGSTDGNLYALK